MPTIETAEAVSAASAAVSDMRQFCARQPEACSVGSQAAVAFGYKAQAGAKMLYDFLTEALAPRETGSVTPASSGKREATVNRRIHSRRQISRRPGEARSRGPIRAASIRPKLILEKLAAPGP